MAEVYGRKVRDDLRAGTPKHLCLPGPHRGVWNLQALAASDEVILTESLIDALSFWCAGFRHVTACYGAGGFTADHERAFEQHGTRRVLIAFDRDEAGDKAAKALAGALTASGIECFRIEFPAGADANDIAVASKNPADALGRAIRSAAWMGTGPGPARRKNAPLPEPEREPVPFPAAVPPPAEPGQPAPVPVAVPEPPAVVDPAVVSPAPAAVAEQDPVVAGGRRRGGSGTGGGGSGAWTRRRASRRCGSTSWRQPLMALAGPGSALTRRISTRRRPGPRSSRRRPQSWVPSLR